MILTFVIIAAVIALDAVTKTLAASCLADGAVTIIPGVLEFTYVENRGAAFGMLADHRWVFLAASSAAIIAIIGYLAVKRPPSRLIRISLALIAGGGVGNMIDRVARGYVTDFINPTFVDFYVFNVADSCVCIGCGLLIIWMIADSVREYREKKAAADDSGASAFTSGEGEAKPGVSAGIEAQIGEIAGGSAESGEETDNDR